MALDARSRPPAARAARRRRRNPAGRLLAFALLVLLLAGGAYWFLGRSAPVLGNPRAPILLAWTTDDLLPELAEAAREADGIGAVATARNGIGWLSSWGVEGAEDSAPEGFQVPVEILVVAPEDYAKFIPEEHRPAFERLAEGGALLGSTGAALRGIESTGTLRFGGTTIPVTGVVPDQLVSSHEMVMSLDTARALGVNDLRYVLVELERGTSREQAEEELRGLLPGGARLDLRAPGDAPVFRPGGTILPQAEIKRIFGEFAGRLGSGRSMVIDPQWVQENTSNVTIPLLGTTRCHNKVIPQMRAAFQEIAGSGLSNLVRRGDFGGCFAPRLLNSDPNSGLSRHAWGISFDFNVSSNPYGQEPSMDPRLVDLLEEHGFTWGGRWGEPDGMHFEYLEEPDAE